MSGISECFGQNGLALPSPEAEEKLNRLFSLLIEYNQKVNLTAITDAEGVFLKHFADSATVLPYLPQNCRMLDVGCGGGFPALPVAILRSDVGVVAMDATAKKLKFVEYAAEKLGLSNISALPGRAEELCRAPYRENFDVVTARAVAPLPMLCELCLPYVRIGGIFIAMKTDGNEVIPSESAIKTLGGAEPLTVPLTLTGKDGEYRRMLIISEKRLTTPPCYPRRYSIIKTKSL